MHHGIMASWFHSTLAGRICCFQSPGSEGLVWPHCSAPWCEQSSLHGSQLPGEVRVTIIAGVSRENGGTPWYCGWFQNEKVESKWMITIGVAMVVSRFPIKKNMPWGAKLELRIDFPNAP